jgi:hypothetical protein
MNQDSTVRARAQAVDIANQVLAGSLSPILGAIDLNRLRVSVGVSDDDPDFLIFLVIDSECEGLPIGRARQHWAPEALASKQADVAHAEAWAMRTGREAFWNVVARFGGATGT